MKTKTRLPGKLSKTLKLAAMVIGTMSLVTFAFTTYYFNSQLFEIQKEMTGLKEENQLLVEKDLARQKEYEQEIEKQIGSQESQQSKLISKLSKHELKALKLQNKINALAGKNKRLTGLVKRLEKENAVLLDLIKQHPLEKAKIVNQLEYLRREKRNWLMEKDKLLVDINELQGIISQNDTEKMESAHDIVKLEEEKEQLVKEIKILPNDYKAFYKLGINYFEKKKFERALWYFSKTIAINSDYTLAYKNRGYIYMMVHKDREKACRDWQKACALGICDNYRAARRSGDCK